MTHTLRRPGRGFDSRLSVIGTAAVLSFVLMTGIAAQPTQARSYKVLHAFTGSPDGALPYAGLVGDTAGNFYGTTFKGGTGNCVDSDRIKGCGVVFELDSSGKETVLYSFGNGADGAYPRAGLLLDATGNLYGTTALAGDLTCNPPDGCGVVFEIATSGKETVLYTFHSESANGAGPDGGLIRDAAGNLYGTTNGGGEYGLGVVFKLDAAGKETVLHSFIGNSAGDGAYPIAGLVLDATGDLYGTTPQGGRGCPGKGGCGTVFKLDQAGMETVLHRFTGRRFPPEDGETPYGGLVRDSEGNLYGTTYSGGSHVFGTVFKLSAAGKVIVLHNFDPSSGDGGYPAAGLTRDKLGNSYGTTYQGGTSNKGTVFKVDKAGSETVLHSFTGGGAGANPYSGLVRSMNGNLYGTTWDGGSGSCSDGQRAGCGVVFMLTP